MASAYLCPVCKANRAEFQIVYKLLQEVAKDEETGEIVYQSEELTTLVREDGRPDVDVRCGLCGYIGPEANFASAARRAAGGGGAARRAPLRSKGRRA